ncbi:tetratricopeptide repeat protein [Chryseolinea sp. T2]|uniref:tetratricopeptide repeat-containing sensor histidine kinase n=1 Tax=Chryseolinea sp. T2 TaxID=3129255 RepID=UPI0030773A47
MRFFSLFSAAGKVEQYFRIFLRVVSVCIGVLTINNLSLAQSGNRSRYLQLIDHAQALKDSLPQQAKADYVAAWKLAGDQSTSVKTWLLNEIGQLYHVEGNYDSSTMYYRQALSLAISAKHTTEEVSALQGIADNFRRQTLHDSSHAYLEKAIKVAREHQLYGEEAGLYNDAGNVYVDRNNLKEALSSYIRAANLYDSATKDDIGRGRVLGNISNVHYLLGDYDKALEYVAQANAIAGATSYDEGIAYNHKLAGRIYRQKKMPDKALQEYKVAWVAYDRAGDKYNLAELALGIGNLYYDLEEYNNALTEYRKALALAREISSRNLITHAYSAIGFAFYALRQWEGASAYMDSTRELASDVGNAYLEMDAYEILSRVESELHHYERALAYKERYISIKDSLVAAENRNSIVEMEAKYQNDKKSAAIVLLTKEQEVKSAELERNRIVTGSIVIAFIAAVVISSLLLNRYRLLNRTKSEIEIERMRNQIARDLHDDIGSTLSSINIISQVALKEGTMGQSLDTHFRRIREQSSKMMENMSDIVWSIDPENDSMEKVVVRMKEFCGEILDSRDIIYSFENIELILGLNLNIESRKSLFLIFKEIVNNTAKYSEATRIDVVFGKAGSGWRMAIADNGKGFDKTTARKGNGLSNIQKRAVAMNAKVELQTEPGNGTTFILEVADIT